MAAARRRKLTRRGLAALVALVVHILILGPILLQQSQTAPPPPRPVELFLLPPRPPEPSEPEPALKALPAAAPAASATSSIPTDVGPPSLPLAPPGPVAVAPVEPGLPAQGPFTGPLKLGCAGDLSKMWASERLKCQQQQLAASGVLNPHGQGLTPPPNIPPAKAAYYEAVLAERKEPSHPPMLGCAVPITLGEGGSKLARAQKMMRWAKQNPEGLRPPHSLKLGPLPCYLSPPKGFFTPEADVASIESFERRDARPTDKPAPRSAIPVGRPPAAINPGSGSTQPAR